MKVEIIHTDRGRLTVIRADENKMLTNADESLSAECLYLGAYDSPDNYREIDRREDTGGEKIAGISPAGCLF